MKGKKWTKNEEKILIKCIKDNPHNLSKAFIKASSRTGRSIVSCKQRWYNCLNNPNHPNYVGSCFLMIGRNSYLDSSKKETTMHKPVQKQSILQKIINFIKNL